MMINAFKIIEMFSQIELVVEKVERGCMWEEGVIILQKANYLLSCNLMQVRPPNTAPELILNRNYRMHIEGLTVSLRMKHTEKRSIGRCERTRKKMNKKEGRAAITNTRKAEKCSDASWKWVHKRPWCLGKVQYAFK